MTTKVHTRYRTKEGAIVPGVTTVLGLLAKPALIHWAWKLGMEGEDYRKVKEKAANIGTITHYLVECLLKGEKPDLGDYPPNQVEVAEKAFGGFEKIWTPLGLKPVEVEAKVVSEEYLYGGCADCIAVDATGREFVLVDLKTSKAIYDEYKMQLAAYWRAWEEMHPDMPIHRACIIRLDKETGWPSIHWYAWPDTEFKIFLALREVYALQKGLDPRRRQDRRYKSRWQ